MSVTLYPKEPIECHTHWFRVAFHAGPGGVEGAGGGVEGAGGGVEGGKGWG